MLQHFPISQVSVTQISKFIFSPKHYKSMQKKLLRGHCLPFCHHKKLLRIMKLILLLIIVGTLEVSATTLYSQETKSKLKNVCIKELLKKIGEKSEFSFWYSNNDLNDALKVSINSKNKTVDQILNSALKNQNLDYEIKDKTIFIYRQPVKKTVINKKEIIQQKKISGVVTDMATGEPIIGADVIVKGTTTGTVTDENGQFNLLLSNSDVTLVISYMGYKAESVATAGQSFLNVKLVAVEKKLDEVVVVGYGVQKKISASGSIASVSNQEIMRSPVGEITNALTGTLSGLTVINNSGHVGKDDPVIRLRGIGTMSGQLNPLIMVDGMERTMNDIDPNEVESISVLKDASSTAVFGVRGANGVILVTTKHGKDGPAKVNFTAEYGVSVPTRRPQMLGSYEYAQLYDQAQINDGVDPSNVKYSAAAIEHYRTGDDPWLYPNTDWQKMMERDYSPQQRYNLNVSGGTKISRYYISAGYLAQTGIWKDMHPGYDNTDWSKRYNFRSNLDLDVTKTTTVSVNLSGYVKDVNLPNAQRADPNDEDWQFFRYIMSSPPMAGAGWIDGKSYFNSGYDTPIKWLTQKGYRNDYYNEVNAIFGISQKLDFITPGLSARAKYGYESNYSLNLRRVLPTMLEYTPVRTSVDVNGDGSQENLLLFKQTGVPSALTYSETVDSKLRHVYFEAAVDYNRTFANNHNVTGLLLYNQSKKYYTESAYNEIPLSYLGLVGRFTYSYKSKYNLEFDMGYNGSENFPKSHRFGFFPAYSGSWVVSEEPFMKNLRFVSLFKLKASYGEVGNDKLGRYRFLYIPDSYSISTSGGPLFGLGGGAGLGTASIIKHSNPDVTWEVDHKQNYAFELELFNKLSLNFDYFYDYRTKILMTKSTYTSYVDDAMPAQNFGKMSNHGYEIEVGWKDSQGKVNYWFKGIYSFARNKVIEMDEPSSIPAWQKQTGKPFGRPLLYHVTGFYETDDQASAANGYTTMDGVARNTLGGKVRKGDLWIQDYNNDGVINDLDRKSYGNYTLIPEITGSFSMGASYKGFDISALFQGVTHALVSYGGESLQPFTSQYLSQMGAQTYVRGAWTEANKDHATFPALTLIPGHYDFGVGSNGGSNDFFVNDATYIRLKTLEVGYTFSSNFLKKYKCQGLRIYVNGSNLYTWDKQKLFQYDPEQPGGRRLAYPQQKIYNLGLNLQF